MRREDLTSIAHSSRPTSKTPAWIAPWQSRSFSHASPTLQIGQLQVLFEGEFVDPGAVADFDVGPNGSFLMLQSVRRGPAAHLWLVQNWLETLKPKVPSLYYTVKMRPHLRRILGTRYCAWQMLNGA